MHISISMSHSLSQEKCISNNSHNNYILKAYYAPGSESNHTLLRNEMEDK